MTVAYGFTGRQHNQSIGLSMKIGIHLHFKGQCQRAFEFYRELFGGSITMLTYGESPAAKHVPVEFHDKVVHASFSIFGSEIAGADVLPDQYEQPKGFQLLLQVDSSAQAKILFNGLSAGGEIIMPLDKTFWSPCYGIVKDQFGISWELNCTET